MAWTLRPIKRDTMSRLELLYTKDFANVSIGKRNQKGLGEVRGFDSGSDGEIVGEGIFLRLPDERCNFQELHI
jgi:hypothetical protein